MTDVTNTDKKAGVCINAEDVNNLKYFLDNFLVTQIWGLVRE